MHSIHRWNRSPRLAVWALAVTGAVHAQTLPPPPVSPAPVVNYEYDAEGNPTRNIQAPSVPSFNFETKASYDTLGRMKDTTDAKLGLTQFGYDKLDRTVQVTDPRGLITQYPRNGLGNNTSQVSPDTGTDVLTYDTAGNLKTRTDYRGVLATYEYDALNRLTSVTYSQSGQASMSYGWQYDMSAVSNGIGRLGQTTSPAGSLSYSYDPQGRVLSNTQVVNAAAGANSAGVTQTVSYGYDAAGHITSIVYPSGRKLVIGYTGGLPAQVTLAKDSDATPVTLISDIQWQPFGPASHWLWQMASGTQAYDRVFDSSGRLTRYPLGTVLRDISYDAADRISAYTHYDAATGAAQPTYDQGFGYDELGRLTQATLYAGSWSFTYDANGNRSSATINGTASPYSISSTSNRITSISNPARGFGYDNAGNTTADGQFSAVYDVSGRMSSLTKAGVTTTYAYDSLGRRVRKFDSTGSASTVMFLYDQDGQLLGEYDQTGNAIREYVWLGSTPIAVFTPDPADPLLNPPLAFFVHTDHLNTPRVVLDNSNNTRWRWMAEPFGVDAAETNPSNVGVFTFNLRFPGQYFDQESGLNYNYFRSYDSSIGRYTQSDPIGLDGGINTYAYVGGNPLSYTDPMGLWASQMGAYVHQRAGYMVFGDQISQDELAIVAQGHEWADSAAHQTAEFTFMHAMRHPGQSIEQACEESNRFINLVATQAMAARRAGNRNQALFLFAVALHTMQDSTSPSHRGFQEWSGHESAMQVEEHVRAEMVYPGRGSELDRITRQAWTAFQAGNINGFKVDCSCR